MYNLCKPIISMFFGIIIRMFYLDHEPPHYHAEFQGQQAKFNFEGELLAGEIRSRTASRLIAEWARLHRVDPAGNWDRLRRGEPLQRIEPLE